VAEPIQRSSKTPVRAGERTIRLVRAGRAGPGGRHAPRRSFLPNGRGCLLCHTAHADISVHTSIIEPEYRFRSAPDRMPVRSLGLE
jgi:hypothetical protein